MINFCCDILDRTTFLEQRLSIYKREVDKLGENQQEDKRLNASSLKEAEEAINQRLSEVVQSFHMKILTSREQFDTTIHKIKEIGAELAKAN